MDWLDYREKLRIGFNDDEKFAYFLNVIRNRLNSFLDECWLSSVEYTHFCNLVGAELDHYTLHAEDGTDRYRHCLSIIERHSSYMSEFLAYYIAFTNSLDNQRQFFSREFFKGILTNTLGKAHIAFEIICDNNEYFAYPNGAKEFDHALVSEPLEWLKDYPKSRSTLIIALRQYSNGEYKRDVADNLRKALETFMQEFLHNSKNLESNRLEISKYLGSQNIDAAIPAMFHPLLNTYKNYNDRTAKHNDVVDKRLLEFLLYQTGVFIRMLLVIKQAETEDANAF